MAGHRVTPSVPVSARSPRFALALVLGMTLQVLWEMAEYASFAAGSSAAQTCGGTIGDFAFDLAGSLAGAAFALVATRGPVEEESEPELATVLAGP